MQAGIDLAKLFKLFVYRPANAQQEQVNQTVNHILAVLLETLNAALAKLSAHTKNNLS